ncbi:CLUMA_CG009813, isoform A [Clunio marinus]|uniref:CLUMA_CG009813, isoform A n=1 Tax=Clunio marinus TaxID=568069 RepID=A0A1J1I9Z9_9DIPT|nr:CLUMA_CG009813, isoform A [Clunio marinus]
MMKKVNLIIFSFIASANVAIASLPDHKPDHPAPGHHHHDNDMISGPTWCTYKGVTYQNNEHVFFEPFDGFGCIHHHCVNGEVQKFKVEECPPAWQHPGCEQKFTDGECCPEYVCTEKDDSVGDNIRNPSFCTYNDQIYSEGDFIFNGPFNGVGCPKYYCKAGLIQAEEFETCPMPVFPNCEQSFTQGVCCPQYDCSNVITSGDDTTGGGGPPFGGGGVAGAPSWCNYKGQTYSHKEFVYRGPFDGIGCTHYFCISGTVQAYQIEDCIPAWQYPYCVQNFLRDQCCPEYDCPFASTDVTAGDNGNNQGNNEDRNIDFVAFPSWCKYNDQTYWNGQHVYHGPFNGIGWFHYHCVNGMIQGYKFEFCKVPAWVNPFCEQVFVDDMCCPEYDCPPGVPLRTYKCSVLP